MNPAGIYTSLWYAKLLKSILVKKKNVAQEGQSPGTALERSYSCAQFWVLPKCHCSALKSDKQVKNSLKNRDKNIPTSVKCGINITNTIPCVPVLASSEEAAYLAGGMKQKLKKSVCVWNTSCRNTMDSSFISVLSNDFLSTLLLGWVRKPPLWQELQEREFFNHIFSPQSRRNHTEWKTQRTRLATGDTQTCILGYEAECYNPLCSFSSPLYWPQVQAARDEWWGWFSWIWSLSLGQMQAHPSGSTAPAHSARWWWRENSKDN